MVWHRQLGEVKTFESRLLDGQLLQRHRVLGSWLGGDAYREIAPRLRTSRVALLRPLKSEPCFDDECQRFAGEVTSVSERALEGFESALPTGYVCVRGQSVFEKVERSTRTQHSSYLSEDLGCVRNRAQRERRQRAVARRVIKRYRLTVEANVYDRDPGPFDTLLRQFPG